MEIEELGQFFFTLAVHLKLYHWNTGSYARHVASGTLFDGVILAMDNFIEVYQGRHGKIFNKVEMKVEALNDVDIIKMLNETKKVLIEFLNSKLDKDEDSDLLNIRDDLVSQINKTLYLFTLK